MSGDSAISNNTITFGGGREDFVQTDGGVNNNTIISGNGAVDHVFGGGPSGGNKIVLGNGAGDFVTLGASVTSPGGDYIATGTGAGDTVTVGVHTKADMFAFALGTSSANFTTVSGAAAGDQVEVNGGQLGGAINTSFDGTSYANLAAFISAIGAPTKGDTYLGTDGTDTFIFTDTSTGHTGAIEITGVTPFLHSAMSHGVLTLTA